MSQVSLARANLQTILDHLTAGVLVLDPQGRMVSANPGATRILRLPMAAYVGKSLTEVPGLEAFAAQVLTQFQGFEGDRLQAGQDYWQQSFELRASVQSGALTSAPLEGKPMAASGLAGSVGSGQSGALAVTNLIARGAVLPNQAWLLVFDDISEVVSAERAQACGEAVGPRDQKPTHPHSALGRTPGDEVEREIGPGRANRAHEVGQNDRGPSRRHEALGQ